MLHEQIKKQMMEAMKAHDTVRKEVLRTALGEISMRAETGKGTTSDEDVIAIIRKLIKSNQETLSLAVDDEQKKNLRREIELLGAYLPQSLGVDEIVATLEPVRDAIRAAGNDGQATGIAMKHLKPTGANVAGTDVAAAVKKIRG